MQVTDSLMAKLALSSAVLGLILLFFLNAFAQPQEIDLHRLDEGFLEKRVEVQGEVSWYHLTNNVLLFTLNDSIGLAKIKCVIFSPSLEQRELVFKNAQLAVQGKVQKYKGELEIVAEKIILLDTDVG